MHREAYAFVARCLAALPPRRLVVELGSRWVNGGIRELLGDATYIGVDLVPGRGVTVLADAADYEGPGGVDTVIAGELLEHTPKGKAIVAHAYDMLQSGGVLIVTCATDPRAAHSGIDGGPVRPGEYYANVSERDLRAWLEPFDDVAVEMHTNRGDLYAMARKGGVDGEASLYDV